MKSKIEQLVALSESCDTDKREQIEQMICNSADYVRQVVVMESISMNLAGRDNENFRIERLNADERR